MSVHSTFSASSSARLIACPGSYSLVQALAATGRETDRPSVYAAQGTAAHKLAEELLAHRGDKTEQVVVMTEWLDEDIEFDGHVIRIDQEFCEHVETYVHYIETLEAFDYELHFEAWVSPTIPWAGTEEMSPPIPLFGTADCWGVNRKTRDIVVVDLKFGSGVKVDVWENPQLLYYALGVVSRLAGEDPQMPIPCPVELVVIQPRVIGGHEPKVFNTDVGAIIRWGDEVLRPAVEACLDPLATLSAGAHCKFCPAKIVCPELQNLALAKTRELFGFNMKALAPDTLSQNLLHAEPLEMWIEALREEALSRLEHGKPVPGFKLVAKQARRKWIDEDAAIEAAGPDILEAVILSPAQAEKKIKHVDLSPYWAKQSSGNTIAHTDDPRPEVDPEGDPPPALLEALKGSLK